MEAITLEEVINNYQIPFVDLIKFNCEGAEFDIIMNLSNQTIRKIGLCVILYHEDLIDYTKNVTEIITLFKKQKFRVLKIKKSESRGWLIVWNMRRYNWSYFIKDFLIRRLLRL